MQPVTYLNMCIKTLRHWSRYHLNDVRFVFTSPTFEGTLLEICNGYQSAALTDMDPICITLIEQPLLEKMSSTMGNHAVTLHLPKSETTIT